MHRWWKIVISHLGMQFGWNLETQNTTIPYQNGVDIFLDLYLKYFIVLRVK